MSKRYGRNQRRKAKAEIAELSHLVAVKHKRILELESIGRRNQEIVNRTAEVLENYFITLTPEAREISGLHVLDAGLRIHEFQYDGGVFDGRTRGDAIDEQSLALMPRNYAEQKIATEMARYFMREVCG